MFLICAFNREHDIQIYSKAQWFAFCHSAETRVDILPPPPPPPATTVSDAIVAINFLSR